MSKDQKVELSAFLERVKSTIALSLGETSLSKLGGDSLTAISGGKLLRSRMIYHLGQAAKVELQTLVHGAAAVELIHAASLLHDDVIDGGFLRRNMPTFWVERGVPGAILVGDLMLFKALDVVGRVENGALMMTLVKLTGEVCDAESEQELLLRGKKGQWENCVSIARRKTGALFAFAGYVGGVNDAALAATLKEAGYLIGTAYQLADDILDTSGDEAGSGKTLGTDAARQKTTAVRVEGDDTVEPAAYIESLCEQAEKMLDPWPDIKHAWRVFMSQDLKPVLDRSVASLAS